MSKKVLFIGFSDVQIELARKFLAFRGMANGVEVRSERTSTGAVDAYVINGDDTAAVGRLALHVRSNPGPVLGVGLRPAPGSTVFAAGPFKPATADRLAEMLAGRTDSVVIGTPGASTTAKVVSFPRAAAPVVHSDVLVVDDSELVRRTMIRKITEYGHSADVAANGEEAMAMLLNNQYRIVFLDVMMPGLDGLEICRRIKRSPEYRTTSVYMLTSKDGMFDKVRASMAGCDGYLVKPLETRKLRDVLEKFFDRPSAIQDSSLLSRHPLNAAELAAIEGTPPGGHLNRQPAADSLQPEFKNTFAATVPASSDMRPPRKNNSGDSV